MPLKPAKPDDPMFSEGFTIFSPSSARHRRVEGEEETKPAEKPAEKGEKPVRTGPPSLLDDEETYQRIMSHFSASFYADCGDDLAILDQIREFWNSHPRLTVDDIMRLSENYLGPSSPHRGNLWPPDPNDEDVYDVDAEFEDLEEDKKGEDE